ncbi:MAG: hypothetical protein QM485_08245 [Flavobacteriaceae bacterium]
MAILDPIQKGIVLELSIEKEYEQIGLRVFFNGSVLTSILFKTLYFNLIISTYMKNILFCIFLFGSYLVSAQTTLNDYKYIIVPKKFDDFKNENKYQTSTLIKHLFIEKGFLTVYDDNLPIDLTGNRCLGLLVEFDEGSSMFTTKVTLRLNDCYSKEVFVTKEGKSKIKEYRQAYGQAIREAFTSFDAVNYEYSPSEKKQAPITVSFKNDVKSLDKVKEQAPKIKKDEAVRIQEATAERQTYKSLEPKESTIKKAEPMVKKAVAVPVKGSKTVTLYAQEIMNGYQLVDSTPKIQMKLYHTSVPAVYLVEKGDKNGVLFTVDNHWIFEYYEGGALRSEEVDIKF